MSASGILNSGAVVFYHPLDNSTEHTFLQDWIGSAEYATGRVGSGLFATIGNIVTVNNPEDVLSEGFLPTGLANVVKLTDTKFVIAYPDSTSVVGIRVVNMTGTTPTFGSEYLFTAPDIFNVQIAALSPSSILIVHNSGDTPSDRPFIRQLDIDASDIITSGASLIISEIVFGSVAICAIDETRAFVTLGGLTKGFITVVEFSGGVLTSGNVEIISDMRIGDTCFTLNPSGCVFNYRDGDIDGQVRMAAISGITITSVGAPYEFSPLYGLSAFAGDHTNGGMARLTDSKFMIFFKEGTQGRLMAADVVGTNITLGTDIQVITWFGHGQITRLTDTKSMVIYKNQDAFPVVSNARVATVDGLTVSLGSVYIFSDEDPGVTDSIGPINAIAGIDPASAFVFYSEHTASERRVKVLHVDTSDASLMGSGYPSMSGYTRVAACMWARNLTAPVSAVTIERGYSIVMNSGSIVLGGSATWDDGDIATLMNSLNDGYSHFLVLDFENTGSDWNLKTSVDGVTWTDQGNQNTGSLSPVLTDTSGEVSITSPEPGQWIDEAVLWGGDKGTLAKFTDVQLGNLYSMASSGLTMDQYPTRGEDGGATEVSASGDLFVYGVTNIAVSGDLFVKGHESTIASGNLYINGHVSSSGSHDLYIMSIENVSASGDLYIAGFLQISGSVDLFIQSLTPISTSGDLFIKGPTLISTSGDLFIQGVDNMSTSGDLFIMGINTKAIYWADSSSNKIQRSFLDGSNIQDVVSTDLSLIQSLVLDSSGNHIYFGDSITDKIERTNANGIERIDIVTSGLDGIRGITISESLQKLYWTDTELDVIKRSDLDGSNIETIVSLSVGSIIQKIAINDAEGKMYWTDEEVSNPTIKKANLDGTSIEIIISSSLLQPREISIDTVNNKIYWVDANGNYVDKANLDGTNRSNISTINGPQAIAIDISQGKVYVGDLSGKIFKMNLDGTSKTEIVDTSGVIRAIDFGLMDFTPGLSSEIDLFISGPSQITDSVDFVIVGTGVVPESVATLGRPIDWLLKTSDHNPQIIGTFAASVSGVNIEVWDVTNGANTAMIIPNSGCYQIGDTGRWGWSTINLPSTQAYSKHYFYLMTSNTDTTFDGQFILDLPESAKWIHPRDSGNYIVG